MTLKAKNLQAFGVKAHSTSYIRLEGREVTVGLWRKAWYNLFTVRKQIRVSYEGKVRKWSNQGASWVTEVWTLRPCFIHNI